MYASIRTALAARGWPRWVFAAAGTLLGLVSQGVWPEEIVRVTRSDGAMVLPRGPKFRLDSPAADGKGLVTVEGNRICCPDSRSSARPQCVTERQLPLGASRRDVIERYGPPGARSTRDLLRYPGIEFGMSNDRIVRMCAVRG